METNDFVFTAMNDHVAVTAIPQKGAATKTVNGFQVTEQKLELTAVTVVFADAEGAYRAGDEVYVRGEVYTHQWAQNVYTLDGQSFVLCPKNLILLKKTRAPTPWKPSNFPWTITCSDTSPPYDR